MSIEFALFKDLLINLDFFVKFQTIRYLYLNNSIQDCFVGMIRFKLVPLSSLEVQELFKTKIYHWPFREMEMDFPECGDHGVKVLLHS